MFMRFGRIAATAFIVIVVSMAVARCGGGMRSPTEPAAVTPTLTPSPTPSPTSTPASPNPTPVSTNSAVFGYVSTTFGLVPQYLPHVHLRLHQDGTADQVEESGSLDGSYAFCCLRAGSAVITATLAGYYTFTATITVGQLPVRYDIQMTPISGSPIPPPILEPAE